MSRNGVEACEDRLRHAHQLRSEAAASLQVRERNIPMLTECDVCGSGDLDEIRCKVICRNCRTILQSCADL